jgi:cytochrome c553
MTANVRLAAMTSQCASVATRDPRGVFNENYFQKELKMKVLTILAAFILAILLFAGTRTITADVSAQDGKKPPEIITLGTEAKLGPIKFNHLDHITKNHSVDGTTQIACVECHHTAQPLAEAIKHPPHKTVWPAERTTTLTADLFEKDPSAPVVNACRDCHAKTDTKPKLLPEIPQVKFEGSAEPTIMTNQQAFHRNCGGCHDEVVKKRPDAIAPTSKKCMVCHKKATTS